MSHGSNQNKKSVKARTREACASIRHRLCPSAVGPAPEIEILKFGRKRQMRLRVKHYLVALAFLTLTMPLYARTHKYSLALSKNTTIGSAQLKPGSYDLTADDAKKELNILQNGKIIATVQGQWVKILGKGQGAGVESEDDKITQVRFSGSDQAFQLP